MSRILKQIRDLSVPPRVRILQQKYESAYVLFSPEKTVYIMSTIKTECFHYKCLFFQNMKKLGAFQIIFISLKLKIYNDINFFLKCRYVMLKYGYGN